MISAINTYFCSMKKVHFAILTAILLCTPAVQAQITESPIAIQTSAGNINGKLLLPGNNTDGCPVVILIAGSGATDMDGNNNAMQLKNNSLKFLAEALCQAGIASVRYDKRGIASSTVAGQNEEQLRFEDYVKDVVSWIDLLNKDRRFTSIFLAGHSEGSLIGMLACQSNADVKGFISIAGAGKPAYEIIETQVKDQQLPEAILDEVISINTSLRKGETVSPIPNYLSSLFRESVQPYLISWYRYNPQAVAKTLSIPMLIVQGNTDIQVPEEDAHLLKQACPQATVQIIEGMNHVLKSCTSTKREEQIAIYGNPELPVHQKLVDAITTFITQ